MISWNKEKGEYMVTHADESEEEINRIIESGIKKIVSDEIYEDNFDTSDCTHCMNFNYKNETCKKNMPNINPWYTKDNNLSDDCEEWDYIYKTEDE